MKDVKEALKTVNDAIKKEGGSIKGDETKGTYDFSGDAGDTTVLGMKIHIGKFTIKRSYSVDKNNITITNDITAESPNLVTCKEVEKKMRAWLK